MMLSAIIAILLLLSLSANVVKKYKKIFFLFSILIVLSFYFFLSKNFFYPENFYPNKEVSYCKLCCNYYDLLTDSIKEKKLYILADRIGDYFFSIKRNNNSIILDLLDTSLYKGRIYLYFGVTPVLLFYLPFNFITGLYLTDKFLVFILSILIFLLSIFLVKEILKKANVVSSTNNDIISVFLIGICNLLPFILMRTAIYEVAITTALILVLLSVCLLSLYLETKSLKKQNFIILFLSCSLCLAVGARPHSVLFIPIFLFSIVYSKYHENKDMKDIMRQISVFLIPCIIVGTMLALYNYFRFDSIFEFGWKYQLNPHNQQNFVPQFSDFIISIKNNFFKLPDMNEKTIFSLAKTYGHQVGNESIVGIVWSCPIILFLTLLPNFLKKLYKENRNAFILSFVILSVAVINAFVTCFIGMIIRYVFEYLSLIVILAITIFLYYIETTKDKILKAFLYIVFIFIFYCSVFINISLLFCKENLYTHPEPIVDIYSKIVSFLF